jgi:pimeloyl-ACP methyl ester carboxylesterase
MIKRTSTLKIITVIFPSALIISFLIVFIGLGVRGFPHQKKIELLKNDKVISVYDSKIRYRSYEGREPAIIFIHGNNLSLDYWEPIISNLDPWHIISLDLIGFAGSDRPDLPYDIESHRKYIIAFMEALGIKKGILIGHSMGGTIAAWTAAKNYQRIVGVVMISLPGVPGSLKYNWPKSLLCKPGVLNRLGFHISNTEAFKYFFPMSLARQTLGVTNSYNVEFADALYSIDQPALLLMSPSDYRTPIAYSKVYKERIENLEYHELPPQAVHMAPRTYPTGTALFIADYLNNNFENELGNPRTIR